MFLHVSMCFLISRGRVRVHHLSIALFEVADLDQDASPGTIPPTFPHGTISPEPEKRAVRILLECFLVAFNLVFINKI